MPDSQILSLTLDVSESTRLDLALLEELRSRGEFQPSRAQLKRFIEKGAVMLQGRAALASQILEPGVHEITLVDFARLRDELTHLDAAEHCFLPILYEDEDLLILDKTSGVPSVSLTGSDTRSAAAAALAHFPALAQIPGTKPLEPGLVHRLDTGTSGVLAFAKTAAEFARLKVLWKTSEVVKTYRAIVLPVANAPAPRVRSIRHPIGRDESSSKRMIVLSDHLTRSIRGSPLPAVTHIKRVTPLGSHRFDLEIEIETGVMHQIRVHLADAGWPIVGDRTYHGAEAPRLMLHAWRLKLGTKSGRPLIVESPLPWSASAELL